MSSIIYIPSKKNNHANSDAPRLQGGASLKDLAREEDLIPFLTPTLLAFILVHRMGYSAGFNKRVSWRYKYQHIYTYYTLILVLWQLVYLVEIGTKLSIQ